MSDHEIVWTFDAPGVVRATAICNAPPDAPCNTHNPRSNSMSTIAGTPWRRMHDEIYDVQFALVQNSKGNPAVWCVGCTLHPIQELILQANELVAHLDRHQARNERETA